MVKRFLFLVIAAAAYAQTTPNSVTVTASRASTLQPDQIVFSIAVDTGMEATRDDVASALQPAGITLANFSSVNTVQRQSGAVLEWGFGLAVPIANMKSTVTLLTGLQQSLAQKKGGFTMSFSVQGTQVSQQAQQSQPCSVSDLISDARAQAQKMASAAGVSLGPILALSTSTSTPAPGGDAFAAGYYYQSSVYSNPPACSMTVKFALGGF